MSRRSSVISICLVLLFAVGVTQSLAKKHKHATIQVYASAPVFTAPFDVGSGTVFCPPNTAATGGGSDYVSGIATVEMGFSGSTAYYVLVDNFDSSLPSQVNVQVACTAGTNKVKARPMTRAQVEDSVAELAAQREAAHRADENN